MDIAFANARLMWLALVQPICKFYDRFHKVAQATPHTLLLIFFFSNSLIEFSWAITAEPDELLPSTQEQDEPKDKIQEEHQQQQLTPYPFMPPIYQTFDMFQKALESIDSKIWYQKKEESKIKVGGYIQAKFKAAGAPNEFSIGRARGKISGNITDDIDYQLMIDAVSGKILKDAYVDFNLYPFLSFRFGQFKVPFGLEGVESSTTISTINRSLVTTTLYQARDLGVRVGGELKDSKFTYAIAVINGSGENTGDKDNYKDIVGRFGVFPFNSFIFGISGQLGRFYNVLIKDYQDKNRIGIDADYFTDYFKLRIEYIQGENDTLGLLLPEVSGKANGWYILCSSKYLYPYEPLIRYEYWKGDSIIKQTTIGINYYFIADSRLMLNYEIRNLISGDNTFLAQIQIVF